jgi:hypothetical protein
MRDKPKFDKYKCYTCRYHGVGSNGYPITVNKRKVRVYCDYLSIMDSSCLKPINGQDNVDLRGEDFNNCKLYTKGNIERKRTSFIIIGGDYESEKS